MSYLIYCLLPNGRYMQIFDKVLTAVDDEEREGLQRFSVDIVLKDGSRTRCTGDDIGAALGFIFISSIHFLHESDLRSSMTWALDLCPSDCTSESFLNMLVQGEHHPEVSIRFVSDAVGYGLYADSFIPAHTYIGEYLGIIHTTAKAINAYSLSYPSVEGNYQLDASEYGGIIRFVNHESQPNCEFINIWHESILHVCCITRRGIHVDEQLTVNYGASYWHEMKKSCNLTPLPL